MATYEPIDGRQQIWAVAEPPHIVVGNPRSLQNLVKLGRLRLSGVSVVVLDEVDACLIDADTRREIHELLSRRLSNTYQVYEEDEDQECLKEDRVFSDLTKQVRGVGPMAQYRNSRQTIMCSATIPQRQHFAMQCYKNMWTETVAELHCLSSDRLVPEQVLHQYIECDQSQRLACLRYILKKELQSSLVSNVTASSQGSELGAPGARSGEGSHRTSLPAAQGGVRKLQQTLVFVDKREDVDSVFRYIRKAFGRDEVAAGTALRKEGDREGEGRMAGDEGGERAAAPQEGRRVVVGALTEDMGLDERADAMAGLRDGSTDVLVCTDIAARGIDVPELSVVIQMSLPKSIEGYIHRAGRVGRLGRPGKVITLVGAEEEFVAKRYSNELGVNLVKRNLKIKEGG
eukprot:gene2399-2879_t